VQNLLELVGKFAERKSDLRVLDQGIDTTTAAGKMIFTVLVAVAEFERTVISERTLDEAHAGQAQARAKLYDAKKHTAQEIADLVGVGRRRQPACARHLDGATRSNALSAVGLRL
jgi:DNA invertase Pin-like site-specific DNA recombinase